MDDPAGEKFVGEVGMKVFKRAERLRGGRFGPSEREDVLPFSNGSFPLTPALSRGERENYTPRLLQKFTIGFRTIFWAAAVEFMKNLTLTFIIFTCISLSCAGAAETGKDLKDLS